MADKTILTKLTLDNASFNKGLSESNKAVLGISASITALGAAALATASMTAKWQDETIKASRIAGVSSETFSGLAHAAQMSGVATQDLTTAVAKLSAMTPEMATRFRNVGINVNEVNGRFKSSNVLLGELAQKMADAKNPADQTSIAVRALGEEGAKLVNMLKDGKKGLADAAAEAERLGVVVSEQAGVAAEKFNDDMARTALSVKGLTMAIGESIIEFMNQNGIMDTVRATIQSVTAMWRSLDSDTKSVIITIGAVIAGVAALALALAGLAAIAPAIGTALTLMFGPVGIAVMAVTAAVAAAAYAFKKYGDQIKNAILPAVDAVKELVSELSADIGSVLSGIADSVKEAFGGFSEMLGITQGINGEVSLLGTVAKVTFAVISTGAVLATAPLMIVYDVIKGIVVGIGLAAQAMSRLVKGDVAGAKASLAGSYESFSKIGENIVKRNEAAEKRIRKIWEKPIVFETDTTKLDQARKKFAESGAKNTNPIIIPVEVAYPSDILQGFQDIEMAQARYSKKSQKEIDAIKAIHVEAQRAATSAGEQMAIGYARVAANIANAMSAAVKPISDLMSTIAAGSNYAAQVQMRNLEVEAIRSKKAYEEQRKQVEETEDAKIRTIEESYDAQIAAITSAEEAKNRAIEKASNERLLLLDSEYQAEKARREAEFAKYMEDEAARYEIEKELILQKAYDKEQRMLNEDVMDATFKEQMKARQAAFDAEMGGLAKSFADKTKAVDDKAKADLKLNEMTSKDALKKLTDEKSQALQAAEADKNGKLATLDQARSAQEKEEEKKRLQVQYDAQVQEFEQMKAVKSVEATAAGIASAAMAFASLAPIPFVGPALGAAAAAVILSTTAMRVGQLNSQRPIKPAGLVAETGGLISGPRHSGGGVDVNAEGGELIFDRGRTAKLFDAVDSGMMGGININIAEGAFQGVSAEDLPEKVSQWIGVELRRQGIAGA